MRVIVLRASRGAFFERRQHKGFMEATPEHVSKLAWNIAAPARCSQAGYRGQSRLLFWCWFRDFPCLRFSYCLRELLLRFAGAEARPDPGSGGSARLQKIIGITRTKDIVMRSKRISQAGPRMGYCDRLGAGRRPRSCDDKLVEELALFSARAAQRQKNPQQYEDAALAPAIELEGHWYRRLRQSDDFHEGRSIPRQAAGKI